MTVIVVQATNPKQLQVKLQSLIAAGKTIYFVIESKAWQSNFVIVHST